MSIKTSALLAGVALAALTAAPALAQSAFDGAYVGGYIGYKDGDAAATAGTTGRDVGYDGFDLGAYAGYGRTFDRFYLGGEVDLGYSDVDGEATVGSLAATAEQDFTYGISARAGFLLSPDILAYGRVGWGQTEFDVTAGSGSFSDEVEGWRYGGGVEVALSNNLLTRVEYTYTDYDEFDFTAGTTSVAVQPDDHAVRVGLAYRF